MHVIAAIRRRLAAESGFTLIELLVTMTIGLVVLIGLMNLIDSTGRANSRLTDRAETVQRARIGVDRMARVLRTQACLNNSTPPLIEGTADSVTFYSDTPSQAQVDQGQDDAAGIVYKPKKVRLTFNATAGTVTQETWVTADGAGNAAGSYPADPDVSRVLADNVARQKDADGNDIPVFRYYGFSNLTTPVPAPIDGNLASDPSPANSVKRIVQIDVALRAKPVSGNDDAARVTDTQTTVVTRNADLSGGADPNRQWGPRCG